MEKEEIIDNNNKWWSNISNKSEELLDNLQLTPLQKSLNLDYTNLDWDDPKQNSMMTEMRKKITNPNLEWTYLINICYNQNGKRKLQDFFWLQQSYEILQKNPNAKIILYSPLSKEAISQLFNKKTTTTKDMFDWLLLHWNFRYFEIPCTPEQFNIAFDSKSERLSQEDREKMYISEKNMAINNIAIIKHSLQPGKIKDPYSPQDEREKKYLEEAFELTKMYFPGLDTIEKMLDYVLHVKLDIPEVMKWQRIEWVYVDVDGTLIDYVPIWSSLEWTQQLRPWVVKLLQDYESQGKSITIRTGGDVKKKEAYLRSLGITRPIVSKYDFAWVTAEIVLDDTDSSAFILQSKILAETYIDTRDI